MRLTRILPIAAVLTACSPAPGPDEAVRAWLEDAEAAIEARDRGAVTELIADNYRDPRGNDRDGVDKMLRAYFMRNQKIDVASRVDEVTIIDESAANVVLTAGVTGSNAGLLGFSADAYRFELELELREEGWRLIGARWSQPAGDRR